MRASQRLQAKSVTLGTVSVLMAAACNGGGKETHPPRRDSTVARMSTATVASARDAGIAVADSVLRRQLPLDLFRSTSRFAPGVKPCAADDDAESPPMLIAAGRARIVGHDAAATEEFSEEGGPVTQTMFKVEITSVARLEPALDAGWQNDTAITAHFEAYVATVGVRTDTTTIAVADLGPAAPTRWVMCDPSLGAFVRANDAWFKVVRWTPSTATWDDMRRLADSVATSP